MIDAQAFKAGMRRLASGVAVVTTELDGVGHGLAATSVTALTAEPPTLLVCVNKSASCHDAIAATGRFCVNLLSTEHADLLPAFATSTRRDDRFAGSQWRKSQDGSIHLTTALAAFDCTVARTVEYGTHTIYIGAIENVAMREEGEALIYVDGSIKRLAS